MTFLRFIHDPRGMTLLDISIMLMVIGLIMGPMMHTYKIYQEDKVFNNTQAAVADAQTALNEFYFVNGRYPCPANLTLGPTDANYGVESCPAGTGTDPEGVLEGGVPFATLKVPVDYALDGFKNKLLYAVTQSQSDNNPVGPFFFNKLGGRITITGYREIEHPTTGEDVCQFVATNNSNVYPNPLLPDGVTPNAMGGGHFTLISFGESAIGAYTAEGNLVEACAAPADATLETENCDGDAEFFNDLCAGGAVLDDTFYDDYILYTEEIPAKIWTQSPIATNDTVSKAGKYIGIGTNDPEVDLDVVGNIKAVSDTSDKKGNAQAIDICTSDLNVSQGDGTTCFRASQITGTDPNMRCDNTNGMTGISGNHANCNIVYVLGAGKSCATGQLMTGFNSDGTPICTTPP